MRTTRAAACTGRPSRRIAASHPQRRVRRGRDASTVASCRSELDVSLDGAARGAEGARRQGLVDARQKRGTFVAAPRRLEPARRRRAALAVREGAPTRAVARATSPRCAPSSSPPPPGWPRARRTDDDLDALDGGTRGDDGRGHGDQPPPSRPTSPSTAPCSPPPTTSCSTRMEVVIETGLAARATASCTAPPHSDDPVPSHRARPGRRRATGTRRRAEAAMRDAARQGRPRRRPTVRRRTKAAASEDRRGSRPSSSRRAGCSAASRPTTASSAGASRSSRGGPRSCGPRSTCSPNTSIGQDPLRIEDHWQVLTKGGFYRGGPVLSSAVAGLDQALWDIAGQDATARRCTRCSAARCATGSGSTPGSAATSPAELREAVAAQVEAGFTAVKMNASGRLRAVATAAELDAVVDRAAAAREALGPDRDFALDFHGRVTAADARRVLAASSSRCTRCSSRSRCCPSTAHLLRDVVASHDRSRSPPASGSTRRSDFLPVAAGRHRRGPARPLARRRHLRGRAGSPRWPRRTACRSPRTARSARSRWPPACRSPSRRRTS